MDTTIDSAITLLGGVISLLVDEVYTFQSIRNRLIDYQDKSQLSKGDLELMKRAEQTVALYKFLDV